MLRKLSLGFAAALTLGGLSLTAASAAPVTAGASPALEQTGGLLQQAQYYYGTPGYYGPRRYYGPRYYAPRRYYGPRYYAPPRYYGPPPFAPLPFYGPRYFY